MPGDSLEQKQEGGSPKAVSLPGGVGWEQGAGVGVEGRVPLGPLEPSGVLIFLNICVLLLHLGSKLLTSQDSDF